MNYLCRLADTIDNVKDGDNSSVAHGDTEELLFTSQMLNVSCHGGVS